MEKVLARAPPALELGEAVLTDRRQHQGRVVKGGRQAFARCRLRFVPGQPESPGSEKSGIEAGQCGLFVAIKVILQPLERRPVAKHWTRSQH